ncbi:MAG: FMN-binding protein [Longimicrobiales bacterium]|nr:FMN-binding protein [Longimicrobiales bacterium]
MRAPGSRRCRRWARLLMGLASGVLWAPGASAQVFMTQDEALALAFPDAEIERHTAFLTEAEVARAGETAGSDVEVRQSVVPYYLARRGEAYVGVAYFDAHRVRTKEEVLMIVIGPDDRIRRIEVLKFAEPPDYLAPEGWIEQLEGRALDRDLSLRGGIIGMAGATLTARAMVDAARRVLALHSVVRPFEGAGAALRP